MGGGGGGTTSAIPPDGVDVQEEMDTVDTCTDLATADNARSPLVECQVNEDAKCAPLRGRTWTMAHNKALLYVVRDNDCCFFEKRTNVEKGAAWNLYRERLKGMYPKLFGSWLLDRKQIRRRILDLVKAHKENEHEAQRATGRGGGMVDEEFAQLCDEVAERVEDAEAKKGELQMQRARAREVKDRNGELLVLHQLQTGGKRARSQTHANSSPDESAPTHPGRRRRTSGDDNRAMLLPSLQDSLAAVLRSQERRDAVDEWKVRSESHRCDPLRHPDPGSLDAYLEARMCVSVPCTGTQVLAHPSQCDEEEVESPNKGTMNMTRM